MNLKSSTQIVTPSHRTVSGVSSRDFQTERGLTMLQKIRMLTAGLLVIVGAVLLLTGCAVTRIELPGGVTYYSGRDIVISNLTATVTGSNGTSTIHIGSVSASASQPTDANTRQIQAVGDILKTAKGMTP